jgi:hypothetical protein
MRKSALARLQAIGMFRTTAMHMRASTSGSCGWGSDLLVTPERAALEAGDRQAELVAEHAAGGTGCVQGMIAQELAAVAGPLQERYRRAYVPRPERPAGKRVGAVL